MRKAWQFIKHLAALIGEGVAQAGYFNDIPNRKDSSS